MSRSNSNELASLGLYFLPRTAGVSACKALLARVLDVDAILGHRGRIWIAEHHSEGYGGAVPDPAVLAAAVLALTERLTTCAAGVILPLHDPLDVAEQWAMLHATFDGRAELGVVKGFVDAEFRVRGLPTESARASFAQRLALLHSLWNGHAVNDVVPGCPSREYHDASLVRDEWQLSRSSLWCSVSSDRSIVPLIAKLGAGLMLNPYTRSEDEVDEALETFYGHGGTRTLVTLPVRPCAAVDSVTLEQFGLEQSNLAGADQRFRSALTFDWSNKLGRGLLIGSDSELLEQYWQTRSRWRVSDVALAVELPQLAIDSEWTAISNLLRRIAASEFHRPRG